MRDDFQIGNWIIQPQINCIRDGRRVVHLEPKVMQVLLALASDPGEVMTHEAIRSQVWPGVFVGEDVLIRAISEIRRSFHDDTRSPHTVQTVPRVGYRLIAPVIELPNEGIQPPAEATFSPNEVSGTNQAPEPVLTTAAADSQPSRSFWQTGRGRGTALLFLLLVVAGLFMALSLWPHHRHNDSYTSRPLTTYPGSELQSAFSPDGNTIAFVWTKPGERGHIYVLSLNSDVPVRLTNSPDQEYSPAWSPDGRSIAYFQQSSDKSTINIIPAMGGAIRQVYTLPVNFVWEYGSLTWTADGIHLIFPQKNTPTSAAQLVELDLQGLAIHALTSLPAGWDGDWMPSVSPDGKLLAFVRGTELSVRDLYVMDLARNQIRQLTHDGKLIVGITWTEDGKNLIFASNRGGSLSLWRVSARGGTPEREPVGGDDAYGPTIARHGNRLAYSHGSADWSIARIGIGSGTKDATRTEILASSEQDEAPAISPSDTKLAFQSWRSGEQEIWLSNIDGSNPVQLTNDGASAGSPSWSPSSDRIAYDARAGSFAHIFVMDANGGHRHELTSGRFNDIVPSWSLDGRWIYFGSNRAGMWNIWRIASDGSSVPQRVTTGIGAIAKESLDGKWLYYSRMNEAGIWRCPISGGSEEKVLNLPTLEYSGYWSPSPSGVYVIAQGAAGQYQILSFDLAAQKRTTLYTLQHLPTLFAGLSLSPSGHTLIFSEMKRAESDINLVEHFQ